MLACRPVLYISLLILLFLYSIGSDNLSFIQCSPDNFFITPLISLLTQDLFRGMLFRILRLGGFPTFLFVVDFQSHTMWLQKMLDMISVFMHFLWLLLCCNIWSILENVPCALEKTMYSFPWGWEFLCSSIKSFFLITSFYIIISLLNFVFPLL